MGAIVTLPINVSEPLLWFANPFLAFCNDRFLVPFSF
jgi:hypothetical protein